MAEPVLSAFLTVIFEKLTSATLKNIARNKGVDAEIKKWQRSLTQIQGVLADASHKEITSVPVKRWLNDLQHLAYDIDDILDGWVTEAMHPEFTHESEGITSKVRKLIPTCCSNFSRTTTMLAGLDDISTKLQDLVREKTDLGLSVKEEPKTKDKNRKLQTSMVDASRIIGRQAETDVLVHKLLDGESSGQNFSIVPIVGMGGVGKTTLARILYNEKQVEDHFQLKAWVCVSDDFDSFAISNVIFQSVTGESRDFKDLNLLQVALRDHLKGKRFLLVLDDVWSEDCQDWETLVGPFHACAPGSKIIMTTRKTQLLRKLGYDHLNQLESLSHDDAVSLIALYALGVNNFDSHLSLKTHGEGIAKKCNGLPLAVKAIGRLLRTKNYEEEYWKEVLNSEMWEIPVESEVVPALKLSYHDLSATLKQLFAYCSLFPKDFLFDKEELVFLWMAEGFLHQPTPNDSTEEQRLGHKYFDELMSRSFFQHAPNNESLFVMHDLMNDLATSVATEFFVRLDNENEKNIRKEMLEKHRHLSFVRERYEAYKRFEPFIEAKSLRTFLATSVGDILSNISWGSFYLSDKILKDLLPQLPLLRVLSLSGFDISEVPESIGTLRHLRYLNLSQSMITQLPEQVCNLYNLQTLILSGCYRLTELPNSFRRLKNLRHLDVSDTPLLFQVLVGIGQLKSLQITLSKIIIGRESGFEIAKVKDFKNLCGNISIQGLEHVQNAIHAHEANFPQKRITELKLAWSDELNDSRNEIVEKEILNELQPCHEKLIQLKVKSYGGLEFPKWVGDPSFLNLKHVSISGCKRCTCLPPLAQLPSLKELFIEGLYAVEAVDFKSSGAGCGFLSLENLSFCDMRGWKKWSGVVLPRLQKLEIRRCPNLVEVTLEELPSLNDLIITKCDSGVLRRLAEVASAVTKLGIYDISGLNDVVWRGVIEYLRAVEELSIINCNEIRYLVQSDAVASKTLVKLRKLKVNECDNLVSIGEKEEEEDNCRSNILPSLRMLDVSNCKNMERCSCPDGIEELTVWDCSSMTVVSFPKGGQEKLRSLTIFKCSKLLERELRGQEMNNSRSSFRMLENVWISGWPNLKSIIELNCCVHLTRLIIDNCESLESFPDNLTSLKELVIIDCPKLDGSSFVGDNWTSLEKLTIFNCKSMDASLPGWVWPPNLRSLQIQRLKKPILEWGPQKKKFPTSLVDLRLYGEDGVDSSSQFSHILPSSLTSLEIIGFEKLESVVPMGLQHLTSLQHLSFEECPNLKEVSLHPQHHISLQHLSFAFCPNLKGVTLDPQHHSSLQHLSFVFCPNLKGVTLDPQHHSSLQHLTFDTCPKMKDLPELLLPSFLSLTIGGDCPALKERYCKNGSYWPLISHIPCIKIR